MKKLIIILFIFINVIHSFGQNIITGYTWNNLVRPVNNSIEISETLCKWELTYTNESTPLRLIVTCGNETIDYDLSKIDDIEAIVFKNLKTDEYSFIIKRCGLYGYHMLEYSNYSGNLYLWIDDMIEIDKSFMKDYYERMEKL